MAGRGPGTAARSVRVTVSRLPRSIADVETVATGYRLAVPAEAIDATRFERCVDSARNERDPAEALRLVDAWCQS